MSYFLRQFNIISSLKSSSDKDLFPLYKTIAPILTLHPIVRDLHTQVVGDHLHLKTQYPNEGIKERKKKPLAVILSWMLAKDTHIEKYCNVYLSRGFDVLTVDMAPKDLLFPSSGSQVIAKNLLDYLNINSHYEKVLVHAFSVGGYLMGEVFKKMRENDKYMPIADRIAGMVCDSAVDFEGIQTGFPRAITKNPMTVKVLEWYVSAHMALMHNVATKHYVRSSQNFHNTPLHCPALFFVSDADKVGSPESNQKVANNWMAKGVDVHMKCWKDSHHVSHMHKHGDEYLSELDRFLSKLSLYSSPNAGLD